MELALKLKELAQSMSVLYVEDEKGVREETAEFLRKFFFTVDTAKNGKEGLELYKKHMPDIVMTDIDMPFMDGEDMMGEIRAIKTDAKIIIISAYDFSDFLVPNNPKGANAFINKPATYDAIVTTLYRVINSSAERKSDDNIEDRIEKLEKKLDSLEAKIDELLRK